MARPGGKGLCVCTCVHKRAHTEVHMLTHSHGTYAYFSGKKTLTDFPKRTLTHKVFQTTAL